jgi:glyoxylase-like metal-dependent hydrolase (beta-lactamase superfamily II)
MNTRRDILKTALITLQPAFAAPGLPPGIAFHPGPANGLLLSRDGHTLAIYGDPARNPASAEMVLFTHHRREAVWHGIPLARRGAQAVVPAAERALFEDPAAAWRDFNAKTRYHDYANQTSKFPATPIPVARAVRGGDRIDWRGLAIDVLDTPGYTRGAVSYLFSTGGARIAATGDLIYSGGRILDIYSLQDAIPDLKIRGYHGWASRIEAVVASLRIIAAWKPDLIVPTHGPLITDPAAAIGLLIRRLQDLYANYLATDAYRHYFGDDIHRRRGQRIAGRAVEPMPAAVTVSKLPPAWMRQVGNSRIVFSDSGAALLFDCGYPKLRDEIRALIAEGRIKKLEGIHISHYHDDHTDEADRASAEFDCPVYTSRQMRDILAAPARFRMPCLTTNPIRRLEVWPEAERRRWREYSITRFYFPGQTLYHDAALVEKDGAERVLFVGDSFTPTGLDDYCLLNRNLLAPGRGFLYCLDLVEKLNPDMLINQHIGLCFRYTPEHIDRMRRSLEERVQMLNALLPWDNINYGLDEQWARFDPYGVTARPGEEISLSAVIANHSTRANQFTITPHAPAGWTSPRPVTVKAQAAAEGAAAVKLRVPQNASGLYVLTADVRFGAHDLRDWFEALIEVRP